MIQLVVAFVKRQVSARNTTDPNERSHLHDSMYLQRTLTFKEFHERPYQPIVRIGVDRLGVTHSARDLSLVRARGKYEKCISLGIALVKRFCGEYLLGNCNFQCIHFQF